MICFRVITKHWIIILLTLVQETVSLVSPQTSMPLKNSVRGNNTVSLGKICEEHASVTYYHYHFGRATLILHGWSWLSTTFTCRLFCQDLSSQTSVFIFSLRTSTMWENIYFWFEVSTTCNLNGHYSLSYCAKTMSMAVFFFFFFSLRFVMDVYSVKHLRLWLFNSNRNRVSYFNYLYSH